MAGPAQVVVSNGAKQAIWQALLAVCSPGDEVGVAGEQCAGRQAGGRAGHPGASALLGRIRGSSTM